MTYYRERFPRATVLPKMHILDEHVVHWLEKWRVGLGFMGEQGAESIHAYFNSLKRTYQAIPNEVERLRCMMNEHFLHVAPQNAAGREPPTKRKTVST